MSTTDGVLALRVALALPCYAADVAEAVDHVERASQAEYGVGVPHRLLIDVTTERPACRRALVIEARTLGRNGGQR